MASAEGIKAGSAYVEIGATDAPLRAVMKAAEDRVKSLATSLAVAGAGLGGLGAAITAPLGAAVASFASVGSELFSLSKATGISVESLSELQLAFPDFDTFSTGIVRFNKALYAATTGSEEALKSFQQLGLDPFELLQKSADEALGDVADRLAGLSSFAQREGAVLALFGRGGAPLVGALSQGREFIESRRGQARDLGLGLTTEGAAVAKEYSRSLSVLGLAMRQVGVNVGSALAPALTHFNELMTAGAAAVARLAKENPDLIQTLATGGAVLGAAGTGLVGLGLGVRLLGPGLSAVASGFSLLGSAGGAALSVFSALPVELRVAGLAAAAVVGAIDAAGGGLPRLGRLFGDLRDTATQSWRGVHDALAAGDLGLAGQVAFAGLRLGWAQLTGYFAEKWENFTGFFASSWVTIKQFASDALFYLQTSWAYATGVMQTSLAGVGVAWDATSAGVAATASLGAAALGAAASTFEVAWTVSLAGVSAAFAATSSGIAAVWETTLAGLKLATAGLAAAVGPLLDAVVKRGEVAAAVGAASAKQGTGLGGAIFGTLSDALGSAVSSALGKAAIGVAAAAATPEAIARAEAADAERRSRQLQLQEERDFLELQKQQNDEERAKAQQDLQDRLDALTTEAALAAQEAEAMRELDRQALAEKAGQGGLLPGKTDVAGTFNALAADLIGGKSATGLLVEGNAQRARQTEVLIDILNVGRDGGIEFA